MSVIRGIVSLYRTGQEKPLERYKARLQVKEERPTLSAFRKQLVDDFGIEDEARKFGLGSFEVKIYRLAKVGGKVENYRISTQQQLDLEFPLLAGSEGESELNGK